jgi:hypothetical protein
MYRCISGIERENLLFARWVCQHVLELHGLDLTQPTRMVTELILEG